MRATTVLIDATRSKDILYTPGFFLRFDDGWNGNNVPVIYSAASLSILPHNYMPTHITIIMHLNDLVDTA